MNCPDCKNGVLEQMMIMEIGEEENVSIKLSKDFTLEGIKIMVCSVDRCGYVEMRATPGALSTAKRIMRTISYGNEIECALQT